MVGNIYWKFGNGADVAYVALLPIIHLKRPQVTLKERITNMK
jgi:hypothetical protein